MHNIRQPEQFSCDSFKRSPLIKDVIHDITHCPVCGAKGIARMRNHIRRVHRNISPEERRKLLRESRRSTQRVGEEYTENQLHHSQPRSYTTSHVAVNGSIDNKPSLEDFLMSMKFPPILPSTGRNMRKYRAELEKAWKAKSVQPLSQSAKSMVWKAYQYYLRDARTRWYLRP